MTGFDADTYRAGARDVWERAAPGWRDRRADLQAVAMPVSQWMAEAVRPQPGHRVLELAAGPGDTGFLVAELIAPGGTLICSDASEAMLEVARERADELRAHVRERLAAFKVPKDVGFATALPRTPSGKLLRRLLA